MPHEYNNIIHKSIIQIRMKTQTETQTTSTLLAQYTRPRTYPLIQEVEEALQTSNIALASGSS